MDSPLFTFPANNTEDLITFGLSVVVTAGAGFALYKMQRTSKKGDARRRQMLASMLVFFLVLIAGATALFSGLTLQRLGTLTLYNTYMDTPMGRIDYSNINNASLQENKERSLIDPGSAKRSTKLLAIELQDGKVLVFSEKNYDVRAVLNAMRNVLKKADQR